MPSLFLFQNIDKKTGIDYNKNVSYDTNGVALMQWDIYRHILQEVFIFENCDIEKFRHTLEKGKVITFQKGEEIYTPKKNARKIGIILSGRVEVKEGVGSPRVLLNILRKGQMFGVAGLFYEGDDYVSHVAAKEKVSVFFLDEDILQELLKKNADISLNYIRFLSERIRFLNRRLHDLTGQTVEEKLSRYVYAMAKEAKDGDMVMLPIPIKDLALALNVGRASLYRAFEALEKEKLIKRENKEIILYDILGLKAYTKREDFHE